MAKEKMVFVEGAIKQEKEPLTKEKIREAKERERLNKELRDVINNKK